MKVEAPIVPEKAILRATAQSQSQRVGWRAPRGLLLWLASLPMLLFYLLPLLALLLRVSPTDLLGNLVDQQVAQAIQVSMTTTGAATGITLVFGAPLAYLLARRRFRGRAVLDTLIDLPMLLPPSVAGIALLVAFGRRGLVGQSLADAGIQIAFTQIAVIMAQVFVASPFFVKSAISAFAAIDRELEQAAAVDGAAPLGVFWRITLPLSASALFGGIVMTWARALGEFGATIIFAGNFPGRTQTMPLAIYIGFEIDLNVALTLSAILLAIAFAVLLVVKAILRQRVEVSL
ncbi:MAG TPA: ABC transporter permease [Ktedonobacterales bacterium]|jgi:molybdate transport system permease protein|nr:ABC transporter permease [Ktedonobacterales bacterium]